MNEFVFMYIYTTLHSISKPAGLFAFLAAMLFIILGIIQIVNAASETTDEGITTVWKALYPKIILVFIPMFMLSVFIPSKDEMKLIIGGGLAWKATQIEGVADLPKNMVDAMNHVLEEFKEDE